MGVEDYFFVNNLTVEALACGGILYGLARHYEVHKIGKKHITHYFYG